MTSSAVKNNFLPPGLVSNLQEALLSRKSTAGDDDANGSNDKKEDDSAQPSSSSNGAEASQPDDGNDSKPVILVTNSDGIESPGLAHLVEALVKQNLYSVHVCAPQSDKSTCGHSLSARETVEVVSAEMTGATAYEVSGTTVDSVSLALSGALFSWSKPLLVISGVNKGSSCGHHMFYSSVVAGAREALVNGVPSISISLNWKKDESQESDFKDAVTVCLPLINATIKDIEKGVFPKNLLLNIEVPTSPSTNKGFMVTKQSLWRNSLCWQAISATRNAAAARFGPNQGLGMQLAQLGRDASAAGAARRLTTQKKNIEVVESVGVASRSDSKRTVKYFRLEMLDKEQGEEDENLDFRALQNGHVAVTPIPLSMYVDSDIQTATSQWLASALQTDAQ